MRLSLILTAMVLGLLLAAIPDAGAGIVESQIKQLCRAEWPRDYRMQTYCLSRQIDAADKLVNLADTNDRDYDKLLIIGRCLDDWKIRTGGYDYRMVVHCADRQIEAYNQMK